MFNRFKFAKITNYADFLMSGKIYMNSLNYFSTVENQSLKQGVQGDVTEGVTGIIGGKVSEISKYLESGNLDFNQAFLREIDFFKGPLKVSVTRNGVTYTGGKSNGLEINEDTDGVSLCVGQPNPRDKCFCLYTFYYSTESKTFLTPDIRLKDFGKDVVIILNEFEFLKRIFNAAHKKEGFIQCQKIRYKNFDNKNIEFWGEGVKKYSFCWQNEYRIIYNEKNPTSSHSVLDIGDISDIAKKMTTEEFLKGKFLDGVDDLLFEHTPVIIEYLSEQQDIDFCVCEEKLLLQLIHALEPDSVRKLWKDTINLNDDMFLQCVESNMQKYVASIQRMTCENEYNRLQIKLFYLIIRIFENYCAIKDKINTHLYFTKFSYYFEIANIKQRNISKMEDDKIKALLEQAFKLIGDDYEYLCTNNDKEYFIHAFALIAARGKSN